MKYILTFFLGIVISILGFFMLSYNSHNGQTLSQNDLDFSKLINEKIEYLKNSVGGVSNNKDKLNTDRLDKINKIKGILNIGFVDPSAISGNKMWDDAMQAYVSGIGDPFTVYLTSKDNKTLHDDLKGSSDFEGIGAVVTKDPKGIMLEKIIKDGPAFNAGLKPLDIVVKADDVDLSGLPLGEGVSNIKGPKGSMVKLIIIRDGKLLEYDVIRDKVQLESVESREIDYKGKKMGYMSISSIGEQTFDQFRQQSSNLLNENINGLILDLRGNGGGFLEFGYMIGSWRSPNNAVVVETKYKDSILDKTMKSLTTGDFYGIPTVVLIDTYTASAGEIIAAAIRDNNTKTELVGTQTFGKGTIQTLKEFSDGSSLKYTIGKRYTPKGQNLSNGFLPGNGLKPNVEVNFDLESYKTKHMDNQLEQAKKTLFDLINK